MAAPRPAWIEAAVDGACYRELILPVRSIFGTGDPWSRMLAFYSIYRGYFRTALMMQLQYRIAMLIWLLGRVIEPLMYLVVWRTVAQQQGGSVGGYSVNDFVVYFIAMMMVGHFTFTWIMWEYVYRIRMGLFSVMLLKPIHPIHSDIADNIGYKFLTLIVMGPTVLLLAWFFDASWYPTLWSLAAFVPVLILAFLMRFYWEWGLAMVAFWTTRIDAMNQAYIVTTLFFSGRLAPLDLFPQSRAASGRHSAFSLDAGLPCRTSAGTCHTQGVAGRPRCPTFLALCRLSVYATHLPGRYQTLRSLWRVTRNRDYVLPSPLRHISAPGRAR